MKNTLNAIDECMEVGTLIVVGVVLGLLLLPVLLPVFIIGASARFLRKCSSRP